MSIEINFGDTVTGSFVQLKDCIINVLGVFAGLTGMKETPAIYERITALTQSFGKEYPPAPKSTVSWSRIDAVVGRMRRGLRQSNSFNPSCTSKKQQTSSSQDPTQTVWCLY